MCQFYVDEDARRTVALPALNRIFSARTGCVIPMFQAPAIGFIRTDGHNVGKHGGWAAVVELKNQPAMNIARTPRPVRGMASTLSWFDYHW